MPFRNGICKGRDYSNDPEFRFLKKLWCLLYKSPSEIQDISLKWSTYFFLTNVISSEKSQNRRFKFQNDHDRIFSIQRSFLSQMVTDVRTRS